MVRAFAVLAIVVALLVPIDGRAYAQTNGGTAELNKPAQSMDDAAAIACREAPTRRCVADLALAAAAEIEDEMWRDFLFSLVVEVYAKSGDIQPVIVAATKDGDVQHRIRSIAQLARAAGKVNVAAARKAFQSAIELADSIEAPMSRLIAYANIGGSAVAVGDRETTREVVYAAKAIGATPPELFAHLGLAKAQATIGELDEALATVDRIADSRRRADTMVEVAEVQAAAGEVESARRTIGTALEAARTIRDNNYRRDSLKQGCGGTLGNRDSALSKISRAQAGFGDIDDALSTVESIDDVYLRGRTLSEIAKATSSAKDDAVTAKVAAAALVAAAGVDASNCRRQIMRSVAVTQARTGDLDSALATIVRSESESESESVSIPDLNEVGEAWARSGTVAAAQQRMARPEVRATILAVIATQNAMKGDVAAATAAINAAIIASAAIAEADRRAAVLMRIAAAHAWLGDVEAVARFVRAAQETSGSPQDLEWQLSLASLTATAQRESGRPREALATAVTVQSPWARVHILVKIADSLRE